MNKYEVWCPEICQTRDDAKTINAFDAELAASMWAEWYDGCTGDFEIVNGSESELLVCVSECASDTVQEFTVYGEWERVYRCRGVKNLGTEVGSE